jgi:hypothetical protein
VPAAVRELLAAAERGAAGDAPRRSDRTLRAVGPSERNGDGDTS